MIVKLHSQRHQTLQEIRDFLAGSGPMGFSIPGREEAYDSIENSLRQLRYLRLGKADKGMVRNYLIKVSGLSRAQVTRLIKQFRDTGHVRDHRGGPANTFDRRYQPVVVPGPCTPPSNAVVRV
jgi:CRP-like cAMP-binding protein